MNVLEPGGLCHILDKVPEDLVNLLVVLVAVLHQGFMHQSHQGRDAVLIL